MIKTFFKHSLIYTFPTVLSRGLGLLLLPIYTRYLNPSEYGVLDLLAIVMSLVNLTIALEISQALARYYQEFEDKSIQQEYVSTAFWFTAIMYFLFTTISFIFAQSFTLLLLNDLSYLNIFYLGVISMMLHALFYFAQNQLKWQLEPKKYSFVSLCYSLITAVVSITLLFTTSLEIEAILLGQISGSFIAFFISFYMARRSYIFILKIEKLKEMLSYSSPLVISSIAVYLSLYIDRIMIKEFLGFHALGIYGMAYKFAAIAGLVISGFQSSLTPLVYKHYKEKNTPENISQIFSVFFAFVVVVLAGSVLFSHEAVMLMTTPEFYSAAPIITPLVAAVFFSQMYIFAPGLGIAKKTGVLTIINIAGALLGIALNFVLIPIFGVIGSAIATFISAATIFFTKVYMAQQYYPIPYASTKLIVSVLWVIISTILIQFFLNDISIQHVLIKFLYIIILSFFLLRKFKCSII